MIGPISMETNKQKATVHGEIIIYGIKRGKKNGDYVKHSTTRAIPKVSKN